MACEKCMKAANLWLKGALKDEENGKADAMETKFAKAIEKERAAFQHQECAV